MKSVDFPWHVICPATCMEKVMRMDAKEKRKEAIICFFPCIPFLISLGYLLILLSPLAHGYHETRSSSGIIREHFNVLFGLLAVYACISMSALIYCLVHLLKIKAMNAATKAVWALVLVTFTPVSFILFWYFEIRKEPVNLPVKRDIK